MALRAQIEKSFARIHEKYGDNLSDDEVYDAFVNMLEHCPRIADMQVRYLFNSIVKPCVAKAMNDAPGYNDGVTLDYTVAPIDKTKPLKERPDPDVTLHFVAPQDFRKDEFEMQDRLKAYHRAMVTVLHTIKLNYSQSNDPQNYDVVIGEGMFNRAISILRHPAPELPRLPEPEGWPDIRNHDFPDRPTRLEWQDQLNFPDLKREKKEFKKSQSWRERGEGIEASDDEISR